MAGSVNIVVCATTYMEIWTPAAESWLRAALAGDRWLREQGLGRICGVGFTRHQYINFADQQLARDFLADPEATHMLHLESDMIIPDWTIEKLVTLQKPVASGVYFLRHGQGQPCLYKRVIHVPKGNEYTQSPVSLFPEHAPFLLNGCCGLGCVLIAREVFETIPPPWFALHDGDNGYGTDMYFYKKVRDAGFEVWVEPAVACAQIDYTVVDIHDYHQRLQHDPTFAGSGVIIGTAREP